LRPAIANARLSILENGSIAYPCKYPIRGKTHRVMPPMEFMARLAAIVPPPRFLLWRYHGVLAPGAPWRKQIVPASEDDDPCSHQAATNSSEPTREAKRARKRTGDIDEPRTPIGDPSLLRPSPEPVAPRSGKHLGKGLPSTRAGEGQVGGKAMHRRSGEGGADPGATCPKFTPPSAP